MDSERREMPGYDAYDMDGEAPDAIYVYQLTLVLVNDRVFLMDPEPETRHAEILDEVQRVAPGAAAGLVDYPLDRAEASSFARYMNWDAVCDAFPDDHPIRFLHIPTMETVELNPADPRLSGFDFNAIRTAYRARMDQILARPNRYNPRVPEIPDEDLPPLD